MRLKERLVIFVAACLYYSGIVKFARWRARRCVPRVIILNYHRAAGGDLRRHLLYLRRHYRMLHLEDALEELYAEHPQKKAHKDRRTPLVLTFDDGYHDNYTHAFVLARELHVPITIFLVPGYIESGHLFWWLEPGYLLQHAQVAEVSFAGRLYRLEREQDRRALAQLIDTRVRYASSVAEREDFLREMRAILGITEATSAEDAQVLPCTWAEVREMEQSGRVSFGAHTVHHPVLSSLLDPGEVRAEVSACRTMLEQRLGHPVRAFAYPLGRAEHIGAAGLQAVRESGYRWALTTIYGINTPASDPHELRRVVGLVSRHWLVMAAEITGVWQALIAGYHVLKGKKKRKRAA